MKPRKIMSVVTLPLKTEPWQADILMKRMEICRRVYNQLLREKMDTLNELEADPAYMSAVKEIRELYLEFDKRDDNFMKKLFTPRQTCNEMLKAAGMTEYALISEVGEAAKRYPEHLSSNMAIYSIAKPLWAAMDTYLHSEGVTLREKSYGEVRSIASDGKSGIRIVDDSGHTLRSKIGGVIAMRISSQALRAKSA